MLPLRGALPRAIPPLSYSLCSLTPAFAQRRAGLGSRGWLRMLAPCFSSICIDIYARRTGHCICVRGRGRGVRRLNAANRPPELESSQPDAPAYVAAEVEGNWANSGNDMHVAQWYNFVAAGASDARIRRLLAHAAFRDVVRSHLSWASHLEVRTGVPVLDN